MVNKLHKTLAIVLGFFLITHIGVHIFTIGGPETHQRALETVQWLYRNRYVEPFLLLAIILQIFTGIKFVARRWREQNKSLWSWLQIISGIYLVLFFSLHTSAALMARHVFDLDTNFYWAAGTVLNKPLLWFFRPYYFFGIVAVFIHIAAALYFNMADTARRLWITRGMILSAIIIATLIVASLSGAFYKINMPKEYIDFYNAYADLLR